MTQPGDPREGRDGRIPGAGVLGMGIFLGALAVLFAASIAGFLVVRLKATEWPPPGMPRLPRGLWVTTLVIGACSVARKIHIPSTPAPGTSPSRAWRGSPDVTEGWS